MIFNNQQISELLNIINRQHMFFIAKEVGWGILTYQDKIVLLKAGFDESDFKDISKIDMAFRFGMLAESLGNVSKDMSYKEFKDLFVQGKFLPLTKEEQYSLSNVKQQAYNDIKGLGNKISSNLQTDLIEVDQRQRLEYQKLIEEGVNEAVLKRKTAKQLSSALGNRTEDWARDFDRMSDFLLHTAMDNGKAQYIIQNEGENAKVYKQVFPNACKHCIRLYLTDGEGSMPRVFLIKDLIANGTNIGRKTDQWKAVLGSTHPWCRCETFSVSNFEYDKKTKMFTKVKRDTKGVKRKSRAKITIT